MAISIDLANAYNGQPGPWGVDTFAEAIRRYEAIMAAPSFHQLLIPDTDTLRAVHALDKQGIRRVVVTGRADQFQDASSRWLKRQFPRVPLKLVTTNHFEVTVVYQLRKVRCALKKASPTWLMMHRRIWRRLIAT